MYRQSIFLQLTAGIVHDDEEGSHFANKVCNLILWWQFFVTADSGGDDESTDMLLCSPDNWGTKAARRRTTGTGRCRYLKTLPRKFKVSIHSYFEAVFGGSSVTDHHYSHFGWKCKFQKANVCSGCLGVF
jgi:hypothetical protein